MPSPNLSQKQSGGSLNLTDTGKDVLRVVYQAQEGMSENGEENAPKLKVNDIISKMSFFYEKIRNAVDYKEEHLLRKNAIERILKRLSLMGHSNVTEVAKTLLVELIRAGYLANNSVPETHIGEVATIIERYAALRAQLVANYREDKEKIEEIRNWIVNLMATEIEERLGDHRVDQVIGRHMFDILNATIVDGNDPDFERDKKIQIYIAIFSKLFKYDDAMLEFLLFRYNNPQWATASEADIRAIAQNYGDVRAAIVYHLNHPFRKQVGKLAAKQTVYFSMLKDAIAENPHATYEKMKNSPAQFRKLIARVCERRYKESRGKLRRGAARSIIYLFLTKSALVFALEIPAILFLGEELHSYTLAINVLFPPALLFLIALFTSVPGDDNTAEIQAGIEEIVYEGKREQHPVTLKYPRTRTSATDIIFNFFYGVTFLISFGFVIWFLIQLNFSFVSIIIFLFFLSFVSFFGIRLARFAKQYSVIESRENIISFFANFFYVPIVNMGKWMSEKFSQLNVLVLVLDFIIEAPFKIFVEMFEQWSAYVKERKEGIVD